VCRCFVWSATSLLPPGEVEIATLRLQRLDPQCLDLEGGALDMPYLRIKGQAILERNFEPTFSLKLAAKDAALIDESAQRHDLDLPLFHAVRERMSQGAAEHGDEDMAATYLTSAVAV
jgi:3-hydroxyisobutyrate dehydrogenase